jgi:hypothetical protein
MPASFLDKVERNDIGSGEKIMLNREQLSELELRGMPKEIERRGILDEFPFIPDL